MGICMSCVRSGEVQIVEQFGAFKKIARPGFNCINCFCCEFVAGSLNMRVQQLNVECETKTKDNVFVRILVAVQFMVEKGTDYSEEGPYYKAFYKLDNAPSQMRSYVLNVVRSEVPSMELDHVFTEKEKIAAAIRTELAEQLSSYGYAILSTLITDIDPDIRVKTAMNEINAAQRLRVAAKEKAEADKIRVVKAAEGDAESKYLQGTGIMRQRQAIINGLREDVKVFAGEIKDVAAKDVMDMMIVTQYFDVLKELGLSSKNSTVFLPHSPGGISDVAGAIRNGFLQGEAGSTAPGAQGMQR